MLGKAMPGVSMQPAVTTAWQQIKASSQTPQLTQPGEQSQFHEKVMDIMVLLCMPHAGVWVWRWAAAQMPVMQGMATSCDAAPAAPGVDCTAMVTHRLGCLAN